MKSLDCVVKYRSNFPISNFPTVTEIDVSVKFIQIEGIAGRTFNTRALQGITTKAPQPNWQKQTTREAQVKNLTSKLISQIFVFLRQRVLFFECLIK